MFVSPDMIGQCEEKYGKPHQLRLNYPTPADHYHFIRSTQKNGRAHDITLYLYNKDRLAVTRKPMYPEATYRPPSGGMNPGESFEAGAQREGYEELGVKIRLDKYLLRIGVDFVYGAQRICWTSHIFQAQLLNGASAELNPTDRHEIVEAVWATEQDFFGPIRRGLLSVGSTGLLYRVHLHDIMWRLYGWGEVTSKSPTPVRGEA